MIKKKLFFKVLKNRIVLNTIAFVLLFTFWYLLGISGYIDETLIAQPAEVLNVLRDSLDSNSPDSTKIYLHAQETIVLASKGWIYSMAIGVLLGVVIGGSRVVTEITSPIFDFFRAIPPILAFPLLLVAFSYGDSAYTWTIIFGCLPIIVLTTSQGISSIAEGPLTILRLSKVKRSIVLFSYGMQILPSIFLSARLTYSFALIIAVVSEMVFTPRSGLALGALARDSEINFNTPVFYACILLIGAFGFITNKVLILLEDKVK